jgi:hypothetical protein
MSGFGVTPTSEILAKIDAGAEALDAEFDAKEKPVAVEAPPATEAKTEDVPVKTDEAKAPEPTSAEISPTSEAPQYTKDYQDWLNKYGGDKTKADRAIWETNNRNAQLAKELEELKAKLSNPEAPTAPAKEETAAEVVPETVKRLDESLQAIEAQYKGIEDKHKALKAKRDEAVSQRSELVDQLAYGDLDFEATEKLRRDIASKGDYIKQVSVAMAEYERDAFVLSSAYDTKKSQRDQAVLVSQLLAAREAETIEREAAQRDNAINAFGVAFVTRMKDIANEGEKIPAESLEDWYTFAKRESHFKIRAEDLNENRFGVNEVPKFIEETKAQFLSMLDRAHRAKAAEYGRKKLADAEVNAPEGAAAVAKTQKTSGFRSQAEVDAFMESASAGF